MDQLALEAAEEMLCHGIVVGIVLAGYALPDSIERQPFPEGERGALDAQFTVKDESLGRAAAADCHVQRFQGHHGINSTGKGIAHPFVGTQALDDGRIEPALSGGNAGNIAPRPDLGAQKMVETVQAQAGWVNPKFCVNSISGANRAKLIQGGNRVNPAAGLTTT